MYKMIVRTIRRILMSWWGDRHLVPHSLTNEKFSVLRIWIFSQSVWCDWEEPGCAGQWRCEGRVQLLTGLQRTGGEGQAGLRTAGSRLTAQCRSGVALLRYCSRYRHRPTSLPLLLHGIDQSLRLPLTRSHQITMLRSRSAKWQGRLPSPKSVSSPFARQNPPSVRDTLRQKLLTDSGSYSEQDREFSLMTTLWAGPHQTRARFFEGGAGVLSLLICQHLLYLSSLH